MKGVKKYFFVLLITVSIAFAAGSKEQNTKLSLNKGWFIKSTTQIKDDGAIVSSEKFKQEKWYSTDVPSTVLSALVKNKVYPDPRVGMNMYLIPDVSDEFNAKNDLAKFSYLENKINPWKDPYWFRKEFSLPVDYKGKEIWLNFDGINYRVDVWLNGNKIASQNEMVGMFRRFKYNVTAAAKIGEKNYLAVKIYQVDHPGVPDPGTQKTVFGMHRGHSVDLFKDETLKFSGGWDCAPVVRDRNMGIYQDVFITATGKIDIENPYIITELPLPDTSSANLTISVDLNNIGKEKVKGILKGEINLINKLEFPTYSKNLDGKMKNVVFSKEIEIPAGSTTVQLSYKDISQLIIKNPHLWWPNGYGKQYLHNLKLTFEVDKKISDEDNTTFGIRQITNELKKIQNEYGRVFYINGKKVFCRGGWIQSEILQDEPIKRAYDEARLMAEANVNMIANEDAPAPPDYIMDSYDKYGIMAWETFYQCFRMYPTDETAHNPLDHDLAIKNAEDIMLRYRNHPSLVLWCIACEVTVDEDLYVKTRKLVKELDQTRPFLAASSYDWDVEKYTPYIKEDLPLGMTDAGAPDYNWNPEPYYFKKVLEVEKQTFRNELGVPSIPVYSSLKKFITDFSKDKTNPIFPLDSVWAEHGAWDYDGYAFKRYDEAIRKIYGTPKDVEDYVRKSQYINANSYRAMYEAYNHKMWDITSGVMLWKLNDCWPSVLWQIYDWYLNPNSAYYFSKKAMEPVHIQLNAHDFKISIVNSIHKEIKNASVNVKVYDLSMKEKWSKSDKINIEPSKYKELFALPKIDVTGTFIVKLDLKDENGKQISDNIYWLSGKEPNADMPDMSDISKLPVVDLKISSQIKDSGKELIVNVKVKNPTDKFSFMNRMVVTKGKDGEEVLPAFWNDNFISLLPGEEKTLTVIMAKEDLNGKKPEIKIDRSGL